MTDQEFIDEILEAIDSEDTATPETELLAVDNWDSLASMITIGIAEDNYGVLLTAAQLRECVTFADIIELLT
jgi:acyl carrier protein